MTASRFFSEAWESAQRHSDPALFASGVQKLPYADLVNAIDKLDRNFISEFVHSFHGGEVYIFTNAFNPKALTDFKSRAIEWGKKQESREPRIVEKVEDYRSRRDWHSEDHGPGYSSTYDMMHFFRWNDDPIGGYELFDSQYRIQRIISGYEIDSMDSNSPDNDVIDRVEVSHYPTGVGGIAWHSDPIQATRFALTVNLNRFGLDYEVGGFAVGTGDGNVLPIDPMIEAGSLVGFLPSVCHGVEIIDPHLSADWSAQSGRWYVAISMITTHRSNDRNFTRPVEGYPTLRQQINQVRKN